MCQSSKSCLWLQCPGPQPGPPQCWTCPATPRNTLAQCPVHAQHYYTYAPCQWQLRTAGSCNLPSHRSLHLCCQQPMCDMQQPVCAAIALTRQAWPIHALVADYIQLCIAVCPFRDAGQLQAPAFAKGLKPLHRNALSTQLLACTIHQRQNMLMSEQVTCMCL